MKTVILLLLAMSIPFPLCYFRMKKYNISLKKMLIIYIVVSTIGFIGARFGPSWVGIKDIGVRLYGLVMFDFLAIFPMSKIMKIGIREYGDFVAPPIMAVCASSKINCMINNCCKGFVMSNGENGPVLFPSAIVEMVIWAIFVIVLLLIEKSQKAEGLLWPILMILFGAARYSVDFLRGSEWEHNPYFFSMPGGQFWSLMVLIAGLIYLCFILYKKRKETNGLKDPAKP